MQEEEENEKAMAQLFQKQKRLDRKLSELDRKWVKLHDKMKSKKQKIKDLLDESKKMISGCKMNSTMLINLVNDLLDLAKKENLTFQLHKGYFNLIRSIQQSFETLKFISDSRIIQTVLDINPYHVKFFEQVYGDSNRYQ
jgi:signal transduction histidine kinase